LTTAASRSVDPVFQNDPWADVSVPALSVVISTGTSDAWINYQKPTCEMDSSLRADAEAFSPRGSANVSPSLLLTVCQLQQLVDAQNSTIASLVEELKSLRAACPVTASSGACDSSHIPNALSRVSKLEADVSSLAGSLGTAVQQSLDARHVSVESRPLQLLQDHIDNTLANFAAVQRAFQAKFDIVNDSFNEKLSLAVDSVVQSNAAQIKDVSGKLIGGFGDLVKKADADGRSRIEDLRKEVQELYNNAKGAAADCTFLSAPSSGDIGGDPTPVSRLCTAELTPFSLGAPVRLHGLKSVSLNNKCGFIVELINKSGRYGVNILGECLPKAILPTNLTNYHPLPDDRCCLCDEWFNLNSLPSCSCGQTCAPEDEDGGKAYDSDDLCSEDPDSNVNPIAAPSSAPKIPNFPFPTTSSRSERPS
jgi:hypothetical protein